MEKKINEDGDIITTIDGDKVSVEILVPTANVEIIVHPIGEALPPEVEKYCKENDIAF